jgi:hypothetical protein
MTKRKRSDLIEKKAHDLIAAIDRNLDGKDWPFKYVVPWKEARLLREAIETTK